MYRIRTSIPAAVGCTLIPGTADRVLARYLVVVSLPLRLGLARIRRGFLFDQLLNAIDDRIRILAGRNQDTAVRPTSTGRR